MYSKELEWARRAVEVLNRALDADPEAIHGIINTRFDCNKELADDPTIQVRALKDKKFSVSALGIINGIIGRDEKGWGFVAAQVDLKMNIIEKFVVLDPLPENPVELTKKDIDEGAA